jgi:hypothetical protein
MVARCYVFKPKVPIWVNFREGLEMEDVDTDIINLVNCTSIWYMLWPFGIFLGYLVYFSPRFGILKQEKSGNRAPKQANGFPMAKEAIKSTKIQLTAFSKL